MTDDNPLRPLTDELKLMRLEIERLQRTSLNREEADILHERIVQSLVAMEKTSAGVQKVLGGQIEANAKSTRDMAAKAASDAAINAIDNARREVLHAATTLSDAAGEARKQAWRYFGGFWVWIASMLALGALLGVLATFWLQGRADAVAFGKYPGLYCKPAGGQIVDQKGGGQVCAFWIKSPAQ